MDFSQRKSLKLVVFYANIEEHMKLLRIVKKMIYSHFTTQSWEKTIGNDQNKIWVD